mmetsp:Transcript_20611/g.30275  ORF Transcript_20611/g.30275 Transcript_20611/m.30275 type:complete len:741 (+) Transcript_20611:3-2225(+)
MEEMREESDAWKDDVESMREDLTKERLENADLTKKLEETRMESDTLKQYMQPMKDDLAKERLAKEDLNSQLEETRKEIDTLKQHVQPMKDDLAKERLAKEDLNSQLEETRKESNTLKREVENMQEELAKERLEKDDLNNLLEETRKESDALKQYVETMQEELTNELEETRKESDTLKHEVQELKKRLVVKAIEELSLKEELSKETVEVWQELEKAMAKEENLKEDLTKEKLANENLNNTLEESMKESDTLKEELSKKEVETEHLEEQLKDALEKMSKLKESSEKDMQNEINNLRTEMEDVNALALLIEDSLQKERKKTEELQAMNEHLEEKVLERVEKAHRMKKQSRASQLSMQENIDLLQLRLDVCEEERVSMEEDMKKQMDDLKADMGDGSYFTAPIEKMLQEERYKVEGLKALNKDLETTVREQAKIADNYKQESCALQRSMKEKIDMLQSELDACVEEKELLDSELNAEREKQYENTSKLEEMVSLLEYTLSLKESLEKRVHDLRLNLDETTKESKEYKIRMDKLQQELDVVSREKIKYEGEVNEVMPELKTLREERLVLNERHKCDIAEVKSLTKSHAEDTVDLHVKINRLNDEISTYKIKQQEAENEFKREIAKIEKSKTAEIGNLTQNYNEEKTSLLSTIDQLKDEIANLRFTQEQMEKVRTEQASKIAHLQNYMSDTQCRLQLSMSGQDSFLKSLENQAAVIKAANDEHERLLNLAMSQRQALDDTMNKMCE